MRNKVSIYRSFYFLGLILVLEFIYRALIFTNFFNDGLLYLVLFTIPISFLLSFLTGLFKEKVNKIILFVLTFLLILVFMCQFVFTSFFTVPFSFSTLSTAAGALSFGDIILKTISDYALRMLLFFIPFVILIIINKKIDYQKNKRLDNILALILFVIFSLIATFSVNIDKERLYSPYNLYNTVDDAKQIINQFGLLTGMRLDIKRLIFKNDKDVILNNPQGEVTEKPNEEIEYNVLELDFDKLLSEAPNNAVTELHNYFRNSIATPKNEYTGIFKDKNLIYVIAEGFNEIAVQESVTPTLYKLVNNGFVFNNFYSPIFLSTTGGEFQASTGLVPDQKILEQWKQEGTYFPFALGNSFYRNGYNVKAFHDWTYTYYKRDITMPSLGYHFYMGCGSGLEKYMNCKSWTPSDIEMVDKTTDMFLGKGERFLTHYFTVSGHSNYNWVGQRIAIKNKSLVENLPYSEEAKAYLATQIELDKALELLLQRLAESGELADTVIALVGDHYPYSLSLDAINELSDFNRDKTFGVNKSNFIIYNSEITEPIIVDKLGSQIDILPTLLNMFGLEYDARMIVGKDILSDATSYAIFSDRSFINDYGMYDASSRKFTPNVGVEITEAEVERMVATVADKFTISKLIVENNYYKYIFKD